jgi:hypothetical protein
LQKHRPLGNGRQRVGSLRQQTPNTAIAIALMAVVIGGFLILSIRRLRRMDVP